MTYRHQIPALFAPRLYQKEPLDLALPMVGRCAHDAVWRQYKGSIPKTRESGCHEGAMTLPEGFLRAPRVAIGAVTCSFLF